jgi:hypothetical protein
MKGISYADVAAYAHESERAGFIRRTYTHLAVAILAFAIIEAMLLQLPIAGELARLMTGGYAWLVVLGAFIGVSWLADRWASSDASPQKQYLGLGLFVVAEAVIFLPLLYVAANFASSDVIPTAAVITGFLFLGLTVFVFTTKKDFSWLRGVLAIGGFVALGVIAASIIFGFSLGIIFSSIMLAYAAGAILYETSQVLHNYRTDQHVAASLALFAGVALLFWYVLRIVMGSSDD